MDLERHTIEDRIHHAGLLGSDRSVAPSDSIIEVLVIRTQEEWAIALECRNILAHDNN